MGGGGKGRLTRPGHAWGPGREGEREREGRLGLCIVSITLWEPRTNFETRKIGNHRSLAGPALSLSASKRVSE